MYKQQVREIKQTHACSCWLWHVHVYWIQNYNYDNLKFLFFQVISTEYSLTQLTFLYYSTTICGASDFMCRHKNHIKCYDNEYTQGLLEYIVMKLYLITANI